MIKTLQVTIPALLLGLAGPASAHVSYADVTGGSNSGSFTNHGWFDGTTTELGDSHELSEGTFFKFQLAQPSLVNITFRDVAGTGTLNPAFSLYAGLFADEAYDDTNVDPLNPRSSTPPSFPKIASPVDNGLATDAFGRVSPFRDTANINFNGQFNALDSWSMADDSGIWHVVEYQTHVGPTGGNSVSLLNYFLEAGDYTIAAAGGSFTDNDPNTAAPPALSGISGQITFSATPVPIPAAVWLFGSALAGMGAFGHRKCRRVP